MAITPTETLSPSHHELMTMATAIANGFGVSIDPTTGEMGIPYLYTIGLLLKQLVDESGEGGAGGAATASLVASLDKIENALNGQIEEKNVVKAIEECCSLPELISIANSLSAQASSAAAAAATAEQFAEQSLENQKAYETKLLYPDDIYYPFCTLAQSTILKEDPATGSKTFVLDNTTVIKALAPYEVFQVILPSGTQLTLTPTLGATLDLPEDGPMVPANKLPLCEGVYKVSGELIHAVNYPDDALVQKSGIEENWHDDERVIFVEKDGIRLTYSRTTNEVVAVAENGFTIATYGLTYARYVGADIEGITTHTNGDLVHHLGNYIREVIVYTDRSFLVDMTAHWGSKVRFWTDPLTATDGGSISDAQLGTCELAALQNKPSELGAC